MSTYVAYVANFFGKISCALRARELITNNIVRKCHWWSGLRFVALGVEFMAPCLKVIIAIEVTCHVYFVYYTMTSLYNLTV